MYCDEDIDNKQIVYQPRIHQVFATGDDDVYVMVCEPESSSLSSNSMTPMIVKKMLADI